MIKIVSSLVALLVTVGLNGCNTVKVEQVRQVTKTDTKIVYAKPGVDFSRFHRLLPAPLEIGYLANSDEPDKQDLDRIRRIFREAFLAELRGRYEFVDEPAENVLHVRASILDMKTDGSGVEAGLPEDLRTLAQSGKLTFLLELRDSLSGQLLLRAGETEPASLEEGSDAWQEVEQAAIRWAKIFRDFLDQYLVP